MSAALSAVYDWICVERLKPTHSPGGIILPATFKAGKHGHSARLKMAATEDTFRARVVSIGRDVREPDLHEGDEVMVWTFAEGDGTKLWTGEGAAGRLFIKVDDIICAVDE